MSFGRMNRFAELVEKQNVKDAEGFTENRM